MKDNLTEKPPKGMGEHSPLPWSVFYRGKIEGIIHAADGSIAVVCNNANAELIVRAVNQFHCAIAPHGSKPKAQRIECPPDLQAARTDADMGIKTPTGPSDGLAHNLLKLGNGCASPSDR